MIVVSDATTCACQPGSSHVIGLGPDTFKTAGQPHVDYRHVVAARTDGYSMFMRRCKASAFWYRTMLRRASSRGVSWLHASECAINTSDEDALETAVDDRRSRDLAINSSSVREVGTR